MKPWNIVLQFESIDGERVPVWCKQIRWFPVEDKMTGKITLHRLPRNRLLFQIVVKSDGDLHRLKVSKSGRHPKYFWQFPDRMEHPTLKVGLGKSGNRFTDTRREIADTLAPKRRVPGDKAEFAVRQEFVAHLNRVLGPELSREVMALFDACV